MSIRIKGNGRSSPDAAVRFSLHFSFLLGIAFPYDLVTACEKIRDYWKGMP